MWGKTALVQRTSSNILLGSKRLREPQRLLARLQHVNPACIGFAILIFMPSIRKHLAAVKANDAVEPPLRGRGAVVTVLPNLTLADNQPDAGKILPGKKVEKPVLSYEHALVVRQAARPTNWFS